MPVLTQSAPELFAVKVGSFIDVRDQTAFAHRDIAADRNFIAADNAFLWRHRSVVLLDFGVCWQATVLLVCLQWLAGALACGQQQAEAQSH